MYQIYLGEKTGELFDTLYTAISDTEVASLLEKSANSVPKIVILDGNLGGIKDGIDIIKILLAKQYTGHIVLCTDDARKAQEMVQYIENNKDAVLFTYEDSKFYDENHTGQSKGEFCSHYLQKNK